MTTPTTDVRSRKEGRVYAVTEYENGAMAAEKIDPVFEHNAPASVPISTVTATIFTIRDFDGESREVGAGVLHLDVTGVEVDLPVTNGVAMLVIELHASVTIQQRLPYFRDARSLRSQLR